MSLIVLSIPIFFLLIGVELLIDKLRGTHYYRLNDAITNLSCGIGSQIVGKVIIGGLTIVGYQYLYTHWRFFEFPSLKADDPVWLVTITWLLLFLGVDFCYYWFHRLAHEISVLWGSHIVHHQSEEYNLTVALRQAWLQGAFSWVFYLPLALIGFTPEMFITVAAINTLYQFWIHTKFIGKLPKPIEYIFNTPSHHRVHHGVNPKYIDRNHAGSLIIWDRMFGTFQEEEEEVVYGITTQTNSWNPLWVNFDYWLDLFRLTARAKGFKNKMKMLFLKPGWRPDELGGVQVPKEVSTKTFIKYDTVVPAGLNNYVLIQYILLVIGTSLFLLKANSLFNYAIQLGITAFIILTIVSFGALLEGKRWAMPMELGRWLLFAIGLPLLFVHTNYWWAVLLGAGLCSILSAFWVSRYRNIGIVMTEQKVMSAV
ncbi:MAG: sterol desaturase family protein [Chitinophagales bacterium]|nr:sterol desaturase family protein [Chitinophagales bacterium]